MLDKTFPTNECSMCILSPKMVEVASNINIEVITLADVLSVEGEPGDMRVRLRIRPRYIDVDKCTGCGDCTAKCPVKIPDPYNAGLSTTRCIRVPFPQAVPGAAVIDPEVCRWLTREKCGNCVKVCQAGAVDFEQKEREETISVGMVIAAPGYKPFDASRKTEYGYGVHANVVTSLVPPTTGLAGVSQAELDIEGGHRTVHGVLPHLSRLGLRAAGVTEYRERMASLAAAGRQGDACAS